MTEYSGYRLGRQDKQGKIRLVLNANNTLILNGVELKLKEPVIGFVKSHEDANKILGIDEAKKHDIMHDMTTESKNK